MGIREKLGIKTPQLVLLVIQIVLTVLLLAVAVYLLVFVSANQLGGWMIASYIQITISVLALILYFIVGHRKGKAAYYLAILPFLGAIFVNILLPQRSAFQIGVLTVLFGLVVAFLLRQEDKRFTFVVSLAMVAVALTFSIYSAITANVSFLGDIGAHWFTYLAMYASIFVPTVMTVTLALIYNVKVTRGTFSE